LSEATTGLETGTAFVERRFPTALTRNTTSHRLADSRGLQTASFREFARRTEIRKRPTTFERENRKSRFNPHPIAFQQ